MARTSKKSPAPSPSRSRARKSKAHRSTAKPRRTRKARGAGEPTDAPPLFLVPEDPREIQSALLALSENDRRALRERLGEEAFQRLFRAARGSTSGPKLGRVVVLHGIMGSNLDARDSGGSWDRVWVHYWRIAKGRLSDLALDANGKATLGTPEVRVDGLYEDYLPLVAELSKQWDVLPFAYDWRMDVDESADKLAAAIQGFAHGQPVHLVAHSMGGLVARRFAQRHRDMWNAIDDPNGRRAGGRLIQLGTPNRGSFAISLFLTGEEKIVKQLSLLDFWHGKKKVVSLLRGFAGSYQMLPPPDPAKNDDRAKLQDPRQWGEWAVYPRLVERGLQFQREMEDVQDPERLIYVAGYDQDTPYRIKVKKPGVFEYQITRDGDGRVPHDLGLLADVRTYYVRAEHGDLPKNGRVLDTIDELLTQGRTERLDTQIAARSATRRAPPGWQALPANQEVGARFEELAKRGQSRGKRGEPKWTEEEANEIQRALARAALGSSDESTSRTDKSKAPSAPPPALSVAVVHGDITRFADAQLYAVGHYLNVLPQFAEKALDSVVSRAGAKPHEMVLRRESLRGLLTGELGSVQLYPWAADPKKLVAVVGMGSPGTFGPSSLRQLGRNLALRAIHLPDVDTVASVVIGSGAGNLTTHDAVCGLLAGVADAVNQIGDGGAQDGAARARRGAKSKPRATERSSVRRVVFVEMDAAKAADVLAAAQSLALDPAFKQNLRLEVEPKVLAGKFAPKKKKAAGGGASAGEPLEPEPTRMSWVRAGNELRSSALTESAVIPERTTSIDLALVDELVERMVDPETESAAHDGALLGRLIVPREFRAVLAGARTLAVEVDRYTAAVHWEMLSLATQPGQHIDPLSTLIPFARQMRTEYSPAPLVELTSDRPLRILVVGDPGDPKEGWDLPGARAEALAVLKLLEKLRDEQGLALEIVPLIGAPDIQRHGALASIAPASRLDVLDRLTSERWDVLHYCGHGDFDPKDPERVGWVFASGLLTSRELKQMDLAPRLVVANACLSARTSARTSQVKRRNNEIGDADLLPSLADEFFHRGVRNYVGTAWEVDDDGAVLFAQTFYETLLGGGAAAAERRAPAETIGRSVLAARRVLYARQDDYGSLWAAYQHYGDLREQVRRSKT